MVAVAAADTLAAAAAEGTPQLFVLVQRTDDLGATLAEAPAILAGLTGIDTLDVQALDGAQLLNLITVLDTLDLAALDSAVVVTIGAKAGTPDVLFLVTEEDPILAVQEQNPILEAA